MLAEIDVLAAEIGEEELLQALNRSFLPLREESAKAKRRDLAKECGVLPEMATLGWKLGAAELRQVVDEWIDSGKKTDGSESPRDRSLDRAKNAWAGWKLYFGKLACGEPMLSGKGRPLLWFKVKSWEQIQADLPVSKMREELRRNAEGLGFRLKKSQAPDKEIKLLSLVSAMVHQYLAFILSTDLWWSIAKCRYKKCPKPYFVLPRRPRRTYVNGLFCCLDHNRATTAMKSMERKRSDGTERLIETAAFELRRKPEQTKKDLALKISNWIAKNPNFRICQQVRVNWVTHHWQEIQKKAEELSHAQRKATR